MTYADVGPSPPRQHSGRFSSYAVAGLMLLAAGGFVAGVAHQMQPAGAAFFPAPDASPRYAVQATDAIPEAVVAAPVEVASRTRRAPSETPPNTAAPQMGAVAQSPPAADASANVPDTQTAEPAASHDPEPAQDAAPSP